MNLPHREKWLTWAALLIIALLVGDRLVLTPLTKAWRDRNARIDALKKSLASGQLLLEREKEIRARWSAMRTNTLPQNASAAQDRVLKAVDRWAQASRISFTSLKPQWKQGDEDYLTLECRADAFGSIQAVTRFLHELETDPLPLKLEGVEITARDTGGQQLTLAVRFSGLLLLEKQP